MAAAIDWIEALGLNAIAAHEDDLLRYGTDALSEIPGVRIVGTLVFGKEAMGLGDVHMMAGIGAVLGWMDPVIAFFLAPFSGILFTIAAPLLGKVLRTPRVLPYGPHLALATLVIVYAKPVVENLLGLIARTPINLP